MKLLLSSLLYFLVLSLPILLLRTRSNPESEENKMSDKTLLIPDIYWGILTVCQEARSEGFQGMVAVAEVIRNRTEKKIFSNGTIRSTVLWPYQFSGWNTKDPNRLISADMGLTDGVTLDCIRAFNHAYQLRTDFVRGSTHYHGDYLNPFPDWALSPEFKMVTQIRKHIFYIQVR